jgi:hypothetical protein
MMAADMAAVHMAAVHMTAVDATAVVVDALLRREARLHTLEAEIEQVRAMIARDRPTHEWRGASSVAFTIGLDALVATLAGVEAAIADASTHTRRARLAVIDGV